MKTKTHIARLSIPNITNKNKYRIVEWLRNCAKEIKKEDAKGYAKPCRFTLMK